MVIKSPWKQFMIMLRIENYFISTTMIFLLKDIIQSSILFLILIKWLEHFIFKYNIKLYLLKKVYHIMN